MTTQTKRIFKRKIYSEMLKWKEASKGKYALLIEGARSEIVRTTPFDN